MNKIYLSGNYIIVELVGGTVRRFTSKDSNFRRNQADDGFIVQERGRRDQEILDADLGAGGTWEDDGAVKWTTVTLETFLRDNTANFSKPVTFESLPDVPGYPGNGGKRLEVNTAETAIIAVPEAKKALFYINQDGIFGNPPTEVGDHQFNNTGLTFTLGFAATGEYTITTVENVDFRKIHCVVGPNDDAVVRPVSIVDDLGKTKITIRKYMLDTAAPVVDGLTFVPVTIYLLP